MKKSLLLKIILLITAVVALLFSFVIPLSKYTYYTACDEIEPLKFHILKGQYSNFKAAKQEASLPNTQSVCEGTCLSFVGNPCLNRKTTLEAKLFL